METEEPNTSAALEKKCISAYSFKVSCCPGLVAFDALILGQWGRGDNSELNKRNPTRGTLQEEPKRCLLLLPMQT